MHVTTCTILPNRRLAALTDSARTATALPCPAGSQVCEKVESKGTTSYNEVADELVAELKDGTMEDGICYDEKNIRRRVYDAINVLMALDIIAKEKKAIIWKGFPASRGAAQQVGLCTLPLLGSQGTSQSNMR
jgi:hypothetical protein